MKKSSPRLGTQSRPNPPSWHEAGDALKDYRAKLKEEGKKGKKGKMGKWRMALLLFILAGFIGYGIFRHFFISGLGLGL